MSSEKDTDPKVVKDETVPSTSDADPEEEAVPHIHAKTVILVLAVYLVYLAGGLNIVIAGAYGRQVGLALGNVADTTWLVQILTVFIAALAPPVSEAANLWGRKWILVVLTLVGVAGSVLTGRSTSIGMALGGQALTGIACASQPLVHAIPSEVIPRRYRAFAQAGVNVSIATASAFGLIVGGVLVRNGNNNGFRVLWYINAGLFAVAAAAVTLLYNPPLRDMQTAYSWPEKLARLDWIGIFLLSGGLTLFCLALTWSQNPYEWSNPHVSATFTIGCVMLLALLIYEVYFTTEGMFHHSLFKRGRNFGLSIGCVFVEGMVFFAVNNYFAFELNSLYDHDTLLIGVRFSILFFTFAISTVVTGAVCTRWKILRFPVVAGFLFFTVFMIVMATAGRNSSSEVWGIPVVFGVGLGILLNTLMTTAQLGTPPELIASASGIIICTRSIGASVGLAIYNAVFSHLLATGLASQVPQAVIPLGLPPSSLGALIGALTSGDTEGISHIPGVTETIISAGGAAVADSFVSAFRGVWITAGCFAFVAMVAAFLIIDPKSEFNTKIDAPAESREALYKK